MTTTMQRWLDKNNIFLLGLLGQFNISLGDLYGPFLFQRLTWGVDVSICKDFLTKHNKQKTIEPSFLKIADDDEPASPGAISMHEIPVDKENPNRCVECRQEFSNHFELKQHF